METTMRTSLLIAAAVAGTLVLSACASDEGYYYGPSTAYAGVDYGGWYDGYYGPFVGGYWGPGGYFYYQDRSTGRYRRDDARHFRRERAEGYNEFHGHAPPPGHRDRRHDRDD